MSDHHREMIRCSLEHLRFLEDQIADMDEEIRAKIREANLEPQWELLQSVPAIADRRRAHHAADWCTKS